MIKYNWCVCDMDGTLLNSKELISAENEQALKKIQNMGVEVVIASGRVDLLMKSFIKQLDLKGYIICCNGGLIKNIKTGEVLYSKVMNKADVKKIITYCIRNNVEFFIYAINTVYSSKNNPKAKKYEILNKSFSEDLRIPIKYVDDEIIENLDEIDAFKILLVCKDTDQVKLAESDFSEIHGITMVSSLKGLLDIMASNTSKGNGLKILSEELDLDLSKIIAFGDNYNDIEMFRQVGMPIAMGNAVDKVKSEAKYITKSNDESGIAYAINNFIMKE